LIGHGGSIILRAAIERDLAAKTSAKFPPTKFKTEFQRMFKTARGLSALAIHPPARRA
jgi:hypothetical protein